MKRNFKFKNCKKVAKKWLTTSRNDRIQLRRSRCKFKQKILITWLKLPCLRNNSEEFRLSGITKQISLTINQLLKITLIYPNLKSKRKLMKRKLLQNQLTNNLRQSLEELQMLQHETGTLFMRKEHFLTRIRLNNKNKVRWQKKKRVINQRYGLLNHCQKTNCNKLTMKS